MRDAVSVVEIPSSAIVGLCPIIRATASIEISQIRSLEDLPAELRAEIEIESLARGMIP